MGHIFDHIIHTYAGVDTNRVIFAAKEDVKGGFWRCVAEEGGVEYYVHSATSRGRTS